MRLQSETEEGKKVSDQHDRVFLDDDHLSRRIQRVGGGVKELDRSQGLAMASSSSG